MNNAAFTRADAQELYERIPGPTWDGEEWSNLPWNFQQFLEAQGDEETAEEMQEVLECFQEASETVHGRIYEALKKYGLLR